MEESYKEGYIMFRKMIVSAFQKKGELSSRMVSILTKYTLKAVNRLVWYTYIKTQTSRNFVFGEICAICSYEYIHFLY